MPNVGTLYYVGRYLGTRYLPTTRESCIIFDIITGVQRIRFNQYLCYDIVWKKMQVMSVQGETMDFAVNLYD